MMKIFSRTIYCFVMFFCFSTIALSVFSVRAFCATEPTVIIAYGDSLTEGCNVEEAVLCDTNIYRWLGGTGYVGNLTALLTENNYNAVVYNFGKGGETVVDSLSAPYRFDAALNALCNEGAEYILIQEGTNDLLHGANGLDVKFNLGIMIDKSRARGLTPLLATLTPDPDHDFKGIELMNTWIRELAVEKDVVLVDQYNALAPHWDVYTNPRACYGDLLHPNATGFDAMGAVWYQSLSALLPIPVRSLSWLQLLLDTP